MSIRLCDICGERPIDPKYREVRGWEEQRQGGGLNKLVGRRETGKMICSECLWRAKKHINTDQGMFL